MAYAMYLTTLTWLAVCCAPLHTWASPTVRHASATAAGQDACGQVAALLNGPQGTNATVPASLAWDCLQAVPLDLTSAVAWLKAVKPYLRWQSTISYIASPPPGYLWPAVDLMAGVDNIITQAQRGKYSNEYQLEYALFSLLASSHDQHLGYYPNMVASVFTWSRSVVLVSASRDAIELPKIYVRDDILRLSNSSIYQPSAVAQVDGLDVNTYCTSLNTIAPFIDPDAAWNALFWSRPGAALSSQGLTSGNGAFSGEKNGAFIYPGASTTLTFENGTVKSYDNHAVPQQTFAGISNAQDVFNQYVTSSKPPSYSPYSPPTITQLPGYPSPIAIQQNGWVSGYYLQGAAYQDVAVLSVPSSEPADDYMSPASNFVNAATQAGKTKLIIDISANEGGFINAAFDLLGVLLPDLVPYVGQRIRATQEVDIIGQTVSDIIQAGGGLRKLNSTTEREINPYYPYPLYYQSSIDANLQSFTSWPSFFGPHQYHGDNFTSIFRTTGFPNTPSANPFKTENIVIVSDGQCGSTCSVFAEVLMLQANIKTIAVGGRPTLGPMQAVGGTRGTNNIGWTTIQSFVSNIYPLLPKKLQASFNSTALADYGSNLPFQRSLKYVDNGINFKDNIRQGDQTGTPLTFVYQPANCRIRQTTAMLKDITAMWKTAYNVAWGNQACVSGEL